MFSGVYTFISSLHSITIHTDCLLGWIIYAQTFWFLLNSSAFCLLLNFPDSVKFSFRHLLTFPTSRLLFKFPTFLLLKFYIFRHQLFLYFAFYWRYPHSVFYLSFTQSVLNFFYSVFDWRFPAFRFLLKFSTFRLLPKFHTFRLQLFLYSPSMTDVSPHSVFYSKVCHIPFSVVAAGVGG